MLEVAGSAVLSASGIISSGTADSFLKASHVTKTRHAHQVTAATLYILQRKAYSDYQECSEESQCQVSFEEWCNDKKKNHPQFAYWDQVLHLELSMLELMHSFRTANFEQYVNTLKDLVPWMFALNHTNYARWLSVHIRDMSSLHLKHPEVFKQFCEGAFVVQKTSRTFSTIALDQAHEQCNALVKGDGGAVGLTNNPNGLRRWTIGGPEISRMLKQFEDQLPARCKPTAGHLEEIESLQKTFKAELKALVTSFEELGNPFKEDTSDLIALDIKNVMPTEVIETVKHIRDNGCIQYNTFVEERFLAQEKTITYPIKRNQFVLFSCTGPKTKSNAKSTEAALKDDCSLFSRLYIACQIRDGDL